LAAGVDVQLLCDVGTAISSHDEGPLDVCRGRCKGLQVFGAKPLHSPGHCSPELFADHKGTRQGCKDC